MRTVMTVFHLGDVISAKVSASPAQHALCSHCGGTIARDKGQRTHGFHGRMQRYIFAGVPALQTSGENFFDLFVAPFSQELDPPQDSGRFSQWEARSANRGA